jgi:hypothetical protein
VLLNGGKEIKKLISSPSHARSVPPRKELSESTVFGSYIARARDGELAKESERFDWSREADLGSRSRRVLIADGCGGTDFHGASENLGRDVGTVGLIA